MDIKIFCMNCKEEILQADTDTLRSPLIGNMFRVKKDMEWSLFSPHDIDKDLICPRCEWCFHVDGKLMANMGEAFVTGSYPEEIVPWAIACSMDNPIVKATKVEIDEKLTLIATDHKKRVDEIGKKVSEKVKEIYKEPDPLLKSLQEQVEFNDSDYRDKKKEEEAKVNKGDWNKSQDTDGDSEANGEAPEGTEATEPEIKKKSVKKVKKVKKRRAKKARRKT